MSFADTFLAEFDTEMAATRRVIERVPSEKAEWRPHIKSFPLGHLAQLVAIIPGWWVGTLREDFLDLKAAGSYSYESTETLLATFDLLVEQARDAIRATTDASLDEPWELRMGAEVLMTMPRGAVARQNMSHLAHHRGQLTVYLRLLDIPVPSIYGPTADEGWG